MYNTMESSLSRKNIVIFSIHKWESIIESSIVFIAKELAKENNIIYVCSPYTIIDVIKHFKFILKKNKLGKILPFMTGVEIIKLGDDKKITLINSPIVFSINFLPFGKLYKILHQINHLMIAYRVKRFLKKRKISNYIFINSFNFLYDNLDKLLKPSLNVYYCVDALIKSVSLKHGKRQEKLAMQRVDTVVVTSMALLEEKKEINPNCFLVENAVDVSHISKVFDDIKIHTSVSYFKKPVLGFFGNIERRMDFILINNIARKHPEWTFALVGPIEKKYFPSEISFQDNVHFVGGQPYSVLPNILKGFDVALIPYKNDKVSKTIYPLKINEYLAAGKSVVSTNFNEQLTEEFADVIYFANNQDEFEQGIIQALNAETGNSIEQRVNKAKQNDWSDRAHQFSVILLNELDRVSKI